MNTVLIKGGYILICAVAALVLALAVSALRSRKLRTALTTLLLVPYFIPSIIFAYMALVLVSSTQSPPLSIQGLVWGDVRLFQPMLILLEVLKTCGIPVVIALAAIGSRHAAVRQREGEAIPSFVRMNVIPATRAITAFMVLQLSTLLTTNFELIHLLNNPLVRSVGDTLDIYMFREGMMGLNVSGAGTVWLIQFIVQLLLTGLAYFLIRGAFLKDLFSGYADTNELQDVQKGGRIVGIAVSVLFALIALVPMYFLFIHPFTVQSNSGYSLAALLERSNFTLYLVFSMAAAIAGLLMTVALAYPMTVPDLPGRGLYKGFLIAVMLMGSGTAMHEYLLAGSLGMLNTIFPTMLFGILTVIHAFVLSAIFNSKYADLKQQASAEKRGEMRTFFSLFISKVWKPLLTLGMLQFVSLWNSYYSSFLYIANKDRFSPITQIWSLLSSADPKQRIPLGDPLLLQYGAIVALLPLILLIVFRKWLTSEVLLGEIRRL
ncbi:hypothetical protein [Paenibacillus ginsengarvi]|nr:hypothetical protein [Paenibacillus ginsengarvi]